LGEQRRDHSGTAAGVEGVELREDVGRHVTERVVERMQRRHEVGGGDAHPSDVAASGHRNGPGSWDGRDCRPPTAERPRGDGP